MKRMIKYIRVFSLMISVLVINFHLVIPHDHHRDIPFSQPGNSCPVQQDKDNHQRFPAHCNILNDLAVENILTLATDSNLPVITCYLSEIQLEADLKSAGKIYTIPLKFPDKTGFTDLHLLRAPPATT